MSRAFLPLRRMRISRPSSRTLHPTFQATLRHIPSGRPFQTSPLYRDPSDPAAHRNFYKTHGRALFKALTLAFFTYQVVYWSWLMLETEEIKDATNQEIKSLETEVRLLDEGRRMHKPGGLVMKNDAEKRLLEENQR